ncbi:ADP-ribosylation factor GTPase activating protein 3 [Carabus blaptoides fortunei]
MANTNPNKVDIEAVFSRLRTIPANKMCFDCSTKNPTWASVTYGVFICIDCSAVHRSLGVHLTFVRSTQLDTNWTWVQLRQMQLGGNANATQFFSQHNCVTADAQKKYNSRAAQLYKDKLSQMAFNSLQTNPDKLNTKHSELTSGGKSKLHLHPSTENTVEEKEVDFFEEHEKISLPEITLAQSLNIESNKPKLDKTSDDSGQPSVILDKPVSQTEERKLTIGVRKIQPKKSSLGAKKGGLGATKVKTNFADLEREAAAADEARLQAAADLQKAVSLSAEEEEKQVASVRLAYQDLSVQQKKHEDKIKRVDPQKAQQVERLGMGFASRSGVSHSVTSDMQTIEQENLHTNTSTLSKLGRVSDSDGFFDDFATFSSSSFSMNRNSSGYGSGFGTKNSDSIFSDSVSRDWVIEPTVEKARPLPKSYEKSSSAQKEPESDVAQKKFGGAKAISSDQYFNNRSDDYEQNSNLNRFQGSTSISSSDYFGTKDANSSAANFHPPDLDDVRESVRQGVTKVAGKLSSLANGVMSSIQDRYGY